MDLHKANYRATRLTAGGIIELACKAREIANQIEEMALELTGKTATAPEPSTGPTRDAVAAAAVEWGKSYGVGGLPGHDRIAMNLLDAVHNHIAAHPEHAKGQQP